MIKTKKQMFIVIGVFTLVMLLGTTTFAFFNYTRTGASNNIKVGRISFVSKDEETITLNNLFPIDPENTTDMNDTTKVGTYQITIEGDTDYSGGIEYLVSTTNSNLSNLPISINMTVGSGLGTNDVNYFTSRDTATTPIYKKIVGSEIVGDQMLLVGFIPQNTTLGTSDETGDTITIKAYLDENKILISDTYDGTESDNMGTPNSLAQGKTVLTTTEWNALSTSGVSFKVKVEANEGIWVKGSLEEIMKQENIGIDTENGVDFSKTSDQDGTKGVYLRAGTQNDDYPIVYYRGAVENNNVVFNNKCWKAVRTTNTGGVKLIYNGSAKASLSESEYTIVTNTGNFIFDSTDNTWTRTITGSDGSSSSQLEISFKVPANENYIMQITGTTSTSGQAGITIYKDTTAVNGTGNGGGGTLDLSYTYGTLTANNVIKMTYYGNGTSESPTIIKVKMVYPNEKMGYICDNSGTDAQITLSGTNMFAFNTNENSPAYNGYMWGEVYEWTNEATTSGAYYGTGFTWDGTNYTLTSAKVGYDGTHHYTCNSTTAEGTCSSIRYYYYVSGTSNGSYYITLTGGDSIEKAIEKMQTNTNSSNAKTQIDTWYAANMSTVTSKLEDTVWCNDRSISSKAGWDPTGNVTANSLYYSAYDRAYNTNVPSLSCANKNDAFTVSNAQGNQKLTYPVALLTSDEMTLAGGNVRSNSMFYLKNGANYWSLSPHRFGIFSAELFFVGDYGGLTYNHVYYTYGIRPAISIKPGQPIMKGSGTVLDPYVIE